VGANLCDKHTYANPKCLAPYVHVRDVTSSKAESQLHLVDLGSNFVHFHFRHKHSEAKICAVVLARPVVKRVCTLVRASLARLSQN